MNARTLAVLVFVPLLVAATPAPAPKPAAPAAAAVPNETILDAVPATTPLPAAQPRTADPWPITKVVRFTIDRVGRVRGVSAEETKLADKLRDASIATVAHWRFWPALGACRYVEQQATVTLRFSENRVDQESLVYEPVTARRALRTTEIARLYALDIGDPRHNEPHPPAGFIDTVPLDSPPPGYPAAASRAAMPGYAFVLIEVGTDGKVKAAQASDAWSPNPKFAPLFGAEAVRAIKRWKFKPATQDGKPVARTACQRFMFNFALGGAG